MSSQPAAEISGRTVFYGAEPGDGLSAVATGDFNGDGIRDIVVAAVLADGPDNSRADGGEVYVFFGPFAPGQELDAALGQQGVTIYGAGEGDQLGRALAAGDLNGDGLDDIVLGAPMADAQGRVDSGAVYVLSGAPDLSPFVDLAAGGADLTVLGADEGDLLGFALSVDDVNGDGLGDIVAGALWAAGPDNQRAGAGEAYVIFGSVPGRLGVLFLSEDRPDVIVYGGAVGGLLGQVLAAGDVNGDGAIDLILPATFAPGLGDGREEAGQTYIIFGPPPTRLDIALAQHDVTIYGVDAGDQLGHAAVSGDVNGDGLDDLLLAAVSADGLNNGDRLAGEAVLIRARRPLPSGIDVAAGEADAVIHSAAAGDRLGRSAAVGDFDGDGLADFALAAPGGDGPGGSLPTAGRVYLFYGPLALDGVVELGRGNAATAVVDGLDAGDTLATEAFGKPPLVASDMDGDGRDELLAAAPKAGGPGNLRPGAGEVYVLFLEP